MRCLYKSVYFTSAYSHQTWHDGDISWGPSTHHVTRGFGHVVLRDHMTNSNHFISNTVVPMAMKLGRMVTDPERLPTIRLFDPLVTWSFTITWQTKNIHLFYPFSHDPLIMGLARSCEELKTSILAQHSCPQNFAGWWYTMRSSHS